MDSFLKTIAAVLVCTVLYLVLLQRNKELSVLLTVTACCMVTAMVGAYLKPVHTFILKLCELAQIESELFGILIKSVGIGFVSEIAARICTDAGNAALGKTVQMLSSVVILWVAIPLFSSLLELITQMLGEI